MVQVTAVELRKHQEAEKAALEERLRTSNIAAKREVFLTPLASSAYSLITFKGAVDAAGFKLRLGDCLFCLWCCVVMTNVSSENR